MAKIIGPVKYTGKIGDYSAYIDKNGNNIVQAPGGPSHKQVLKEARFSRFRDNIPINSAGSSAGKAIRDGFGFITRDCKDGSLCERLSHSLKKEFSQFHPSEVTPDILYKADITKLEGFQWNARTHLDTVFHPDHATFINPALGDTDIVIASFNPAEALRPPQDATHFSIVMAALSFHQASKQSSTQFKRMEMMSCSSSIVPTAHIRFPAPQNSPSLVISGLGIIFFGQVRTKFKTLPESAFTITRVCRPALLQAS